MAAPGQLRKHEIAKRIILLTLPNHDRAYVRGSQTLNEIWSKLLAKYMPSIDAEARKLWSMFSALRQSGRPMVEHVNDCMTVRNLLEAIGVIVPDKQFVDNLLNVDRELSYLRPMCSRLRQLFCVDRCLRSTSSIVWAVANLCVVWCFG